MLIKMIKDVLIKPYDFLKDRRIKFVFTFVLPAAMFFFLWLLGPFGLAVFPDLLKLELISLECLSCSIIFAIHFYLLQKIFIKNFNIGATILWLIWLHFVIGLSNTIIYGIVTAENNFPGLVVFDTNTFWMYMPRMFFQTFLIGLLPTLSIIMLYNFFYMKKKITVVNQINYNLTLPLKTVDATNVLSLPASNLREVINVHTDSLTYIISKENYVEIHWLEKGIEKNALLRNTLSNIEKEISKQCRSIKRCHLGYIVNMNRVKSFTGNEAGYKILLDGIGFPVPVSRKYKKSILDYLKQ